MATTSRARPKAVKPEPTHIPSTRAMPDGLPFEPDPAKPEEPRLDQPGNALPAITNTAIKAYDPMADGLKLMLEQHGHVLTAPPIVTAENRALVAADLQKMVVFRTTLEKVRKAEKQAALEYGNRVDAGAKALQAKATPIEKVYKDALETFDTAEQERKDAILKRIRDLRAMPMALVGKPLEELRAAAGEVDQLPLIEFQEFREEAAKAQLEVYRTIQGLIKTAEEAAEAQRLAEEARREAQRVQALRERIAGLRMVLDMAARVRTTAMLTSLVASYKATQLTDFAELHDEAAQVHADTLTELERRLRDREAADKRAAEEEARREQAEKDAKELAELRAFKAQQEAKAAVPEVKAEAAARAVQAIDQAEDRPHASRRSFVDPPAMKWGPTHQAIADQAEVKAHSQVFTEAAHAEIIEQSKAHGILSAEVETHAMKRGAAMESTVREMYESGQLGGPVGAAISVEPNIEIRGATLPSMRAAGGGGERPRGSFAVPTTPMRPVAVGQDAEGNMLMELSPTTANDPRAVTFEEAGQVEHDGLPITLVGECGIPTELGLMPELPGAVEMIEMLANQLDDHPLNILAQLAAAGLDALREHFTQPSLENA